MAIMDKPKNKHTTLIAVSALLLVLVVFFGRNSMTGEASYYADALHGKPTASGELYDKRDYTAAHRDLDFGTELRVTYPETGESVVVEVNDRGPHTKGRIIDLSKAAAKEIGLVRDGVGVVEVVVLD